MTKTLTRGKSTGRLNLARILLGEHPAFEGRFDLTDGERRALGDPATAPIRVTGTYIPASLMRRASPQVASTDNMGGFTVEKEIGPALQSLWPAQMLESLGVRVLVAEQNTYRIPQVTQHAVATWKTEVAAADQMQVLLQGNDLKPARLTAYAEVSRQLLLQSSVTTNGRLGFGPFLEDELRRATEMALLQALCGSISPAPPDLNGSIVAGAATVTDAGGASVTHDDLLALEKAVYEGVNVPFSTGGEYTYLVSPDAYAAVSKEATVFNWPLAMGVEEMMLLNGRRCVVSTAVPSGTILFGRMSDIMLCHWGGLDIQVNPYMENDSLVRFVVLSYWNWTALPNSFAVLKNIAV